MCAYRRTERFTATIRQLGPKCKGEKTEHQYHDILSAAKGLLCESTHIVSSTGLQFSIIGGWSPYFLNNGPIAHPGSRDVDILFEKGASSGSLAPAMNALMERGYLLSAKHDFQLLRVLNVGGERFVFNVDLLHADDVADNPELFADHVSLPILLDDFTENTVSMRSIRVAFANFLFDGHVVPYEFSSALPNGEETVCSLPLMDETGTLITKAESMRSPKRRRDAFDILLAIVQARDPEGLLADLSALATTHEVAFCELPKLRRIKTEPKFRANIERFWPGACNDASWDAAVGTMIKMLDAAHVPPDHVKQI